MSETPLTINPPGALARLSAALSAYAEVSGREATGILEQKGAQIVFGNTNTRYGAPFPGLVQLFRGEKPARGEIFADAQARGFRLGSRSLSGGLSLTALSRASAKMGGYKSILVSAGEPGEELSFIRVSPKGRRVHFRNGRKSFAVAGDTFGPLPQGQKRLNFRAVATYFELRLREAGRGFLGSSFMFRRWRLLAQSDPRRLDGGAYILTNQNPRSSLSLLGEAALTGDTSKGNATLRITSFAPGVAEIGNVKGFFSRVVGAVSADIGVYMARKMRERAVTLLSKTGSS